MSTSSKRQIVHLLRSIVHANRLPARDRHKLRGSLIHRSRVIDSASNYLAQLQTAGDGRDWDGPAHTALNRLVGDLRALAKDDVTCDSRLKAIERLLRIDGHTFAPVHDEPIDRLVGSLIEPQVEVAEQPVEQTRTYTAPPPDESWDERVARLTKIFGGDDERSHGSTDAVSEG
jgi:hypothetical protein